MTQGLKKERERRILRCIYNESWFESIIPSECPDFVIRRRQGTGLFGVEVTEMFGSHSNARLECLPDYASELLDGNRPRHKDDITALEVVELQLIGPDGSVEAENVPGIKRKLPSINKYRELLAQAITTKGAKRNAYSESLDYIELIVRDHDGRRVGFSGSLRRDSDWRK